MIPMVDRGAYVIFWYVIFILTNTHTLINKLVGIDSVEMFNEKRDNFICYF